MLNERSPQSRPRCRSLKGVRVIGTGSYVPDGVITNDHLHQRLGFDSNWIVKRTGILERRHVLPHQATSDLCHESAVRCITAAGVDKNDIDLLVLATFTPDMAFPSTACLVQDRLRLNCPAIEIEAACAGFMYALITGAALLSRPACGSRMPPTPELLEKGLHYMYMDGRAVFRWAVAILCDTIQDVLKAQGVTPGDVDLYIPHQANIRIINAAIDVLHIPRSRVFNNLEKYGNTSAGSVPLALDEAVAEGRVKDGDLIVLSGFGAGLTWGTALMRW